MRKPTTGSSSWSPLLRSCSSSRVRRALRASSPSTSGEPPLPTRPAVAGLAGAGLAAGIGTSSLLATLTGRSGRSQKPVLCSSTDGDSMTTFSCGAPPKVGNSMAESSFSLSFAFSSSICCHLRARSSSLSVWRACSAALCFLRSPRFFFSPGAPACPAAAAPPWAKPSRRPGPAPVGLAWCAGAPIDGCSALCEAAPPA
mmetsp:Transcript_6804/g.14552  ORF Transcript_6804/g.14552 Transcript_6804/m.14552 type:complete len:200 (-) Transcript_6804:219-818(-)